MRAANGIKMYLKNNNKRVLHLQVNRSVALLYVVGFVATS